MRRTATIAIYLSISNSERAPSGPSPKARILASDELPPSYAYQSLPLAYEWSILMDRPPVSLTSAAIHSHTRAYFDLCRRYMKVYAQGERRA